MILLLSCKIQSETVSIYVTFIRVKSGIFGQTAKFGQRPCLFHNSNI